MIDWFPSAARAAAPDDRRRLERWQGVVNLRRLARTVDARDPRGADHSPRVADLAAELAADLGWPGVRIEALRDAVLVRDVGHTCLPGFGEEGARGAAEEGHAALGAHIASATLAPDPVAWIRHHHERFDGGGYPDGLRGGAIPEGAQLIAVADAFDALCHGHELWLAPDEALARCHADRGSRFAPWAVDALARVVRRRAAQEPVVLAPLMLVPVR